MAAQTIAVLGCGNPLLDISAVVDDELFGKYEIQPGSACLAEEKHTPLYDELAANPDVKYIPGGSTLNTIRVCQWLLGNEHTTGYIGCIGGADGSPDANGARMVAGCAENGVSTAFAYSGKGSPTGRCAVAIQGNGERSLVADLSAANDYVCESLDEDNARSLWENANIAYIAGFWLTVCPEGMVKLGQHMEEQNKTFAMNISAPFLCQFFKSQMDSVLPFVSLLFGNEDECAALAGAIGLENTEDLQECAKAFSTYLRDGKAPRKVIITQGAKVVIVAEGSSVQTFEVPALAKEDIVDLNGAGDSFVGGYLAGQTLGRDEQGCVALGNYGARTIIQVSGCELTGKVPEY